MRKLWFGLILILCLSSFSFSQAIPALTRSFTFQSATTSTPINNTGQNYGFIKAKWELNGAGPAALSACTFTVQGSSDGVTFSTTPIAAQTCTSDGQTVSTAIGTASSYIRVNVSAYTISFGIPTLSVNLSFWPEIIGATATNPVTITGTVVSTLCTSSTCTETVVQPTAANLNTTARVIGNAGGILDTTQNATVAANSLLQGCNFTSSPNTVTTGNQGAVQCNSKGELLTQITDGTTNAGVIAATTALKTDLASIAGTATVNGGVAGTLAVGGNVAAGIAPTGNPVLMGLTGNSLTRSLISPTNGGATLNNNGDSLLAVEPQCGYNTPQANSSAPTGNVTNQNFTQVQCDISGRLIVTPGVTQMAWQAAQLSGVTATTTTRNTFTGLGQFNSCYVLLRTTTTGTATGTLQIYIEDSSDGGTTWDDLISSLTIAFGAAVSTQRFTLSGQQIGATITTAASTNITQGSTTAVETLAAGSARQGPWGDQVRIREKVSGPSGSPVGVTYKIDAVCKN